MLYFIYPREKTKLVLLHPSVTSSLSDFYPCSHLDRTWVFKRELDCTVLCCAVLFCTVVKYETFEATFLELETENEKGFFRRHPKKHET